MIIAKLQTKWFFLNYKISNSRINVAYMYLISLDYVVPVNVTKHWWKLEFKTFNLTCVQHWLRDVCLLYTSDAADE